jgi:hypothetical protein
MPDMKQIPLEARQQPKKEMIKTEIELISNFKVCELTNTQHAAALLLSPVASVEGDDNYSNWPHKNLKD